MKKLICVAGFAMVACLVFAGNERGNKNYTGEINFDGDVKIKGTKVTVTAAELNCLDGLLANQIIVGDVSGTTVAYITQTDTNSTTTVTTKTPAFAGQVLVGKEGGTNQAWIACGTTTNDWVVIMVP
jgi:hypothetical protein